MPRKVIKTAKGPFEIKPLGLVCAAFLKINPFATAPTKKSWMNQTTGYMNMTGRVIEEK